MGDFERRRQKAAKIQRCMTAGMAFSALGCQVESLKRKIAADSESLRFGGHHSFRSLGDDLKKAYGQKFRHVDELAKEVLKFEERREKGGLAQEEALESLGRIESLYVRAFDSVAGECGKPFAPRKVFPKKEVEMAGKRRRRRR